MPTTTPKKLPLHRKIEKALVQYLHLTQKKDRVLKGITIEEGHSAKEPKIPWLAVYARNPKPADDMPPETRIKNVELVLHLKTHSDDEAREDGDARLEEIDAIFADFEKIIAFLNHPETGPDMRQVKEVYVYAIHEGDQPEQAEDEVWNDQRVFEVIAQNWDPDR